MNETINKALEVVKGRIPSLMVHADMQKASQAVLNLSMVKSQYATLGDEPTDELDEELTFVLKRVRPNLGATEMQQVTQAALLLMNAKAQCQVLEVSSKTEPQGKKTPKKQGAGAA